MEDNLQTIVVIVVSVFLLFIFPVYMAYEKKDDITYALAMRYTQDLVDEVRGKGYITKEMYDDYSARLLATGNTYDIQMTHEYNRYDPITNYYKIDNGKYILLKTTTQEVKEQYEKNIIQNAISVGELTELSTRDTINEYLKQVYKDEGIDRVEDTYQVSRQVYNKEHILAILNSERKLLLNASTEVVRCEDDVNADDNCQYAYTMNVDDTFNVIIKNTNITLATVVYNMVTANVLDNNTRIYVNYGGTILSSKWFGNIDYSKMKHDNLSLDKFSTTSILAEERNYVASNDINNPTKKINMAYDGEYGISFDVKPTDVTELREKGRILIADYTGYNFALGNSEAFNTNSMLSASVGINGISLVANSVASLKAVTPEAVMLPEYQITVNTEGGGVELETRRRKVTDYSSLTVSYVSQGNIRVTLTGKSGVPDYTTLLYVADTNDLLNGLNRTITNPSVGSITGTLGMVANRGTSVNYSINMTNSSISISAEKYISDEVTILSYPTEIKEYTSIKIDIKKVDEFNDEEKYIAILYVNDEEVEQSIEMNVIPKVDIIGMTYIGNEARYFDGYIKNVKLYN